MTISREMKKAVDEALQSVKKPVSLVVFTQEIESPQCRDARQLAELLAESSERISVEVNLFVADYSQGRKYQIDRIPAIVVASKAGGAARFYGAPSGYEFLSFLDAVKAAAAPDSGLADETLDWLSTLKTDLRLEAYGSPFVPACSAMITLVSRLGLASPRVIASSLSIVDYPEIAVARHIKTLPTLYAGDALLCEGPISEKALVERLA